jgi:phospholipase C
MSIEKIKHWVVVMFENRSFDNLLGHLPHIDAEDGIRDREITLPYPGGVVTVHPSTNFTDPIPDPGEGYPNVNAQIYGRYEPASNAGKAAYPIFPDFMEAPFNAAPAGTVPTMDGFALDYYYNSLWQAERKLTDAEMQSIGAVFTPETLPVLNGLAQEYAVFTNWHCEVPSCTFPNRTFYHAGTSTGRVDNDLTYNYAWDNDLPNLFDLFTEKQVPWKCYFPKDQVVPLTAINLAGARHLDLWRDHTAYMPEFYDDCANGTLPAYSWVEPSMMTGDLDDYHPPTDVRAAEALLAKLYNAVRTSPAWEDTALVIMWDEHGGTYDHVVPPAAIPPDDIEGEEGFKFDRYGIRVPFIVVSAHTKQGTVIRDLHSNTSLTRTLRELFDLGPQLSRREGAAKTIEAAFNRSQPRKDMHELHPLPYTPGVANPGAQQPVAGDLPDAKLLVDKHKQKINERVSELGEISLRNAARFLNVDPEDVPDKASSARKWLGDRFVKEGKFYLPRRHSA